MKPCTVLVSACLLGQNVKYNGGNNDNPTVHAFLKGKRIIPVCPEVLSGMPVPRPPVEIYEGRVVNEKGADLTAVYQKGVDKVIQQLTKESVDLAILKARSPTCGNREIYDGTFSHYLIPGQGLLAAALTKLGIPVLNEKDIESLMNR